MKVCFKTKFSTNYKYFIVVATVYSKDYTNSNTCYENHVPSTIIITWIELRIFDEIVTSTSF